MNQVMKTVIHKTIHIIPAAPQKAFKFRNYYQRPNDGTIWHDEWNHTCNDRGPACDCEIEPYFSEDI